MSDVLARVAAEQAEPLPPAGVAALVASLWPDGAELVRVERLLGGLATGMHRVEVRRADGSSDAVVVRTVLAAWGDADQVPAAVTREHTTLSTLARVGAPSPAPRWLDAEGEVLGRPALAMAVVPGRPVVSMDPPDVQALARVLADLHALPVAAFGHLGPAPDLATQVRRGLYDGRAEHGFVDAGLLWSTLDRWILAGEPPPPSLVHGDFHPGNVLSDGDRVTVVDWTMACLGDPGRDLAYCRYDLALANGLELAEAFTTAYLAAGGRAAPSAGWDLAAVASSLPTPAAWLRGFAEAGRDDLTPELFEARGRAFLAGAYERL